MLSLFESVRQLDSQTTDSQKFKMKPVRFLMIGGFLGAGKTTTISKAAQHYMERGFKVGLVTNDQAYNLVDTQQLRAQGFDVGEVPGACFCCKFDDLVSTTEKLGEVNSPDIIIAEPVGSCTALVATVIEPLRQLYGDRFQIGPLAVLLKPVHGKKILRSDDSVGFSPKAAYIFLKQIEEAEIVAINKIDKLTDHEQQDLLNLMNEKFPEKQTILISAREELGLDELFTMLSETNHTSRELMDVDYVTYAEGEAELGWLNCQVEVFSNDDSRFRLDETVQGLTEAICALLANSNIEPAHLKLMGQYGVDVAVANLVDSTTGVELSLSSEIDAPNAELIVNARVATDPNQLRDIIETACTEMAASTGLHFEVTGMQSFSPAPPEPTHRVTD